MSLDRYIRQMRYAPLGEAGQRRARVMFDLRSMCERTEAVYLQIVAARAEGQPVA